MKYIPKYRLLVNIKTYSSLFLILIMFSLFSLTARANVYVIKDKQGKVIRTTSQYQMHKQEKDAGYIITILIEDRKETKQVSK